MNLTAHIRYAPSALPLTRVAAAGALLLFAVLVASEILRLLDFTDTTPRVLRAAFVLFTVLAAGAAVIEHYMAATCELQRLNAELERRIAEKSEEIKSTYARVEDAKREWALVSERQHIGFDLLYKAQPPARRRMLAIFLTASILLVFIAGLPGSYDYVSFLRRKTMFLHVPMALAYSCFLVFLVIVIATSFVRLRRLLGRDWQAHL